MKQLYLLTCIFFCFSINAQNTAIPDSNFEQALIDLGIDSDGIINGHVLTSDIETVITLNLDHKGIEDLTGIEDFTALEILDVTGNLLTLLDVSNNVQLKELYCSSDSAGFNMPISILDLSNNVNLEMLYGENLIFLESLNLKNGNNASLQEVTLPCEFEGEPCELSKLHCVTVDDEEAANNDESPYSNWSISADFVYSEDCTLGVSSENNVTFSLYPNPTYDILVLSSATTEILSIKILNLQGKLLSIQELELENQTSIDVSELATGIYFLNIQDENGNTQVKKFIKQ